MSYSKRSEDMLPVKTDVSEKRTRKLTEKARMYYQNYYESERKSVYEKLMRKSSHIDDLMHSYENLNQVEKEIRAMDELLEEFMCITEKYHGLLSAEEVLKDSTWQLEVDRQTFHFKRIVNTWLRKGNDQFELQSMASTRISKCSKSSKGSRLSHASSRSIANNPEMEMPAQFYITDILPTFSI